LTSKQKQNKQKGKSNICHNIYDLIIFLPGLHFYSLNVADFYLIKIHLLEELYINFIQIDFKYLGTAPIF